MNAGRDVEQLIAGWLADEAEVRAPDRVLESARRSIDQTRQRRELAAWREPVYISQLRLAGMAAVMAITVIGAGFIGRASAPGGGAGTSPTTAPATPTPSAATTVEAFRAARDEICTRYESLTSADKDAFLGTYEPGISAAELATKVDALRRLRTQFNRMLGELQALPVPPELATDQAVALANQDSTNSLIFQILDRFDAGDLKGAQALDIATNTNSRQIEDFERRYSLKNCP